MKMGSRLLSLYTSSQASRTQRRLLPIIPASIRRYSEASKAEIEKKKEEYGNLIDEERAHSTAEEFRRVAEKKTRGIEKQRVEEAESAEKSESPKDTFTQPPGNDFRE